ncbi:MAG TPA: hypothetical protein PLP01_06695, partial [Phycisphaerae bacterium]|nr:hypothetical protein [Phycisphaerae bacterium]
MVDRRLVLGELAGRHTHRTRNGVELHIWKRRGRRGGKGTRPSVWRYVARFHHQGGRPGPTLGEGEEEAEAGLRRVMTEIEDGTFVAPSSPEAKRRNRREAIPDLTIFDLNAQYVHHVRTIRGRSTAKTYEGRLSHVNAFFDQEHIRRRCPLARDIDEKCIIELAAFLRQRAVSRNGRHNGATRPMSSSTRREVLQRLKAVLTWGCDPRVRKLPADFVQPVTNRLIGHTPQKDLFRPPTFSLERRIRLVQVSDPWQLMTFATQYVLPLRPEQLAGLLVPEINWTERILTFGRRFGGHDFTKGRTTFRLPFPAAIGSLLRAAVNGRADGPLFLRRSVVEGRNVPTIEIAGAGGMEAAVFAALAEAPKDDLQADGDAKRIIRRTICAAGGVSEDELRDELLALTGPAGIVGPVRYYDLRSDVVTEMQAVGVDTEYLRYIMGHKLTVGGSLEAYLKLGQNQLEEALERYWRFASELLSAIAERAEYLGLA